MFLKIFYIVAIICIYIGCVTCPLYENDLTTCDNGLNCIKINSCRAGVLSLMNKRSHNLKRCGFEGIIEKVCCPEDNPVTKPITATSASIVRISEDACTRFSNEILTEASPQILGGEDAVLGEFPHMAAIGYNTDEGLKWQCGGTLISNKYVLTAAHCIVKIDNIPPSIIRLGIVSLNGDDNKKPVDVGVLNITIHDEYNRRTRKNDIALLELDKPVSVSSSIHPACLYQENDDPRALVITGWGHTTSNGEPSNVLQKAFLQPVDVSECSDTYVNRMQEAIAPTQICAVSSDGKVDTCQGDSGGPLQVQKRPRTSIYSIVGVTSYGMGCGGRTPGVYTRVYNYLDWIEKVVWPNSVV